MSDRSLHWTARVAVVAAATVAFTAIGGAAATADSVKDDPTPVSANHTIEVFREVVKPFDSITIPSRSCDYGYLENTVYSPGRIVPKGVEVVEPGGIGVTISHSTGPIWDIDGRSYRAMQRTDAEHSYSGATNWDPFTSREVVIKLHCTTDINQTYLKDLGPTRS
ncbi:MAG: hypothetical protein ABJA74_07140 [Lapillicoccus sp.]